MPEILTNIAVIDDAATQYIRMHRDPDKICSGHEESHLRSVARLTELAGLSAGFCSRDIELARIAGWFHDFERSMNETNSDSDEALSVKAAVRFANQMHQNLLYYTSQDEREAIESAILKNGRPPEFFTSKPDVKQWTLPVRVQAALFVADKMEANGVWVIARRSQFVGGARLCAEDADLPKFGLQPGKDAIKAVLLEGAVRIAFINPEGIYPQVFRPLTSKMYDPQRDFMHGLLSAEGMSIADYTQLLLKTKLLTDLNQPNYLQARIKKFLDEADLVVKLTNPGGLSDTGIENAKGDLANSAAEAVTYFSTGYIQPLEVLVETWDPQYTQARLWKKDMLTYINGDWFKQMREQLMAQRQQK